jgi:class 3 adenylate cyclase
MNKSDQLDYQQLEIRVGIHTGNIIAGMIGTKLVKYDIFGENVLIASKMRLNGQSGSVCVS